MRQARIPRDLESRQNEVREEYVPPSNLPDPTPRPGVRHRWVMTHVLGAPEATNVSRRLREGWEPVRAEDYPELKAFANKGGNVEIGGLLLCAIAEEKARAYEDYVARRNRGQMEAVDQNFMREEDSRMPIFSKRKSSVVRGSGFGSGN